ncbi:MAG TPA: DUF3551 domain-containing protein [Pseudolabrys sp.]|nr:DUF3551 domain-containing protein [Pseudolabrys sp.]
MRTPFYAMSFVLALVAVTPAAQAGSVMREARWCIVHNPGLGNIQWDCRYRTLPICAASVGWRSDMCLENPNWHLPGYYGRW